MLTLSEVQDALPIGHKDTITQDMVDEINNLGNNPEIIEYIRENLTNFAQVLNGNRYRTADFVNAVIYVTHNMLIEESTLDSYKATLPKRYKEFIDSGRQQKEINGFIIAYNQNKLVNLVREKFMFYRWKNHILRDKLIYQSAINIKNEIKNKK